MKKTLKQRLSAGLAVLALTGGGIVLNASVGASAAEAGDLYPSYTRCYMTDFGYGKNPRYTARCFVNYPWTLEIWPTFARDGYYNVWFGNTRCAPAQYQSVCA